MNWDTNMALWHVTHADGRSAVVRAESGPLAMHALGWKAARFEMLTAAGEAEIVMQAAAPTPEHDYQQYIEVLNEEGRRA